MFSYINIACVFLAVLWTTPTTKVLFSEFFWTWETHVFWVPYFICRIAWEEQKKKQKQRLCVVNVVTLNPKKKTKQANTPNGFKKMKTNLRTTCFSRPNNQDSCWLWFSSSVLRPSTTILSLYKAFRRPRAQVAVIYCDLLLCTHFRCWYMVVLVDCCWW